MKFKNEYENYSFWLAKIASITATDITTPKTRSLIAIIPITAAAATALHTTTTATTVVMQ